MEIQNKYLTNNLEQTARNLNSATRWNAPGDTTGHLEREIEITLDQLRKLDEQEPHDTQFYSFSQLKRNMGAESIQTGQYIPQYVNHSASPYNRQANYNETQQRPHFMKAKQKRKPIVHEDRVQKLKQKLFSLLEKHKQSSTRKIKKYWAGRMTDPISGLLM